MDVDRKTFDDAVPVFYTFADFQPRLSSLIEGGMVSLAMFAFVVLGIGYHRAYVGQTGGNISGFLTPSGVARPGRPSKADGSSGAAFVSRALGDWMSSAGAAKMRPDPSSPQPRGQFPGNAPPSSAGLQDGTSGNNDRTGSSAALQSDSPASDNQTNGRAGVPNGPAAENQNAGQESGTTKQGPYRKPRQPDMPGDPSGFYPLSSAPASPPKPVDVPEDVLHSYEGTYKFEPPEDVYVNIVLNHGKLTMETEERNSIPLTPISQNVFLPAGMTTQWVVFVKECGGRADQLKLVRRGWQAKAIRQWL